MIKPLLVVVFVVFSLLFVSIMIVSVDFKNDIIDAISESDSNLNGAVDVYVQDQTTFPIDVYASTIVNSVVLTVDAVIDDIVITVNDTTGAVPGMAINFYSNERFLQSIITSVDGNNITIASPLDVSFMVGDSVTFGEWDLSLADGSVTPVSYYVIVPQGVSYDFYTMILSFEDSSVMYDNTFGGLDSLVNPFVGRIVDGYSKTLFIVTNNGGFREFGFTTIYPDKVPSGSYSFSAVKDFRVVNGVSLRINGRSNDYLEFVVNNDFTDLDKLAITLHGHIVEGDS